MAHLSGNITLERILELLPQLDAEFLKELALTDKPPMELAQSWSHWRKAVAKRLNCSWQLVDKRCRGAGELKYLPAWNRFDILMPHFLASWHPTRNERPPSDYGAKSHDSVWWKTPKTDDHPYDDHEWFQPIATRTDPRNTGFCPCCPAGKRKYIVYSNSLKGVAELGEFDEEAKEWKQLPFAKVALAEWDYEKNEKKPEEVAPHDNGLYWFICKKEGHSWSAILNNRMGKGHGCQPCSGKGPRKLSR